MRFLWTERDGMIDLGTLGGSWSYTQAVNERGQVAGTSALAGNQVTRATLWDTRGHDTLADG